MIAGDPSVPQTELDKLYQRLLSRGVVERPDRFVLSSLFSALAQRPVAVWSLNAALTLVEFLAESLPSEFWRGRVFLGHDFSRVSV
jgi:hypothetical protein